MRDIWSHADEARGDGFAVEDMLHAASKAWVNRAIGVLMADGLDPHGEEYGAIERAMRLISGFRLGEALRFADRGLSVGAEAEALAQNLERAVGWLRELSDDLAARKCRRTAAFLDEVADEAQSALGML